jgi:hypothetical protein
MSAPVEAKVTVSSVAALLSSAALGQLAVAAGHAVPQWAAWLVTAVVTGLVTFVAGWWTRHTPIEFKPIEGMSLYNTETQEEIARWQTARGTGKIAVLPPVTTFHSEQIGTTPDGKPIIKPVADQ